MENKLVLIVDDDREIANLFSVVLGLVGFTCEVVHTARDGLAFLAKKSPDIVLLDLRLGQELSGTDILAQIRANPRLRQTRVIIVTGYPSMAESVRDQADMILIKPVEIDQLRTLVQRLSSMESKYTRGFFKDPLTSLYNAEFFYARLDHAFERAKRRPDFYYAVIYLHLDVQDIESKPVHMRTFDEIIRLASDQINRIFRPTDTLARLSNNVFVTLHEELKQPDDLYVLVKRFRMILSKEFSIQNGNSYKLIYRIGSAGNDLTDNHARRILERAEASASDKVKK